MLRIQKMLNSELRTISNKNHGTWITREERREIQRKTRDYVYNSLSPQSLFLFFSSGLRLERLDTGRTDVYDSSRLFYCRVKIIHILVVFYSYKYGAGQETNARDRENKQDSIAFSSLLSQPQPQPLDCN